MPDLRQRLHAFSFQIITDGTGVVLLDDFQYYGSVRLGCFLNNPELDVIPHKFVLETLNIGSNLLLDKFVFGDIIE